MQRPLKRGKNTEWAADIRPDFRRIVAIYDRAPAAIIERGMRSYTDYRATVKAIGRHYGYRDLPILAAVMASLSPQLLLRQNFELLARAIRQGKGSGCVGGKKATAIMQLRDVNRGMKTFCFEQNILTGDSGGQNAIHAWSESDLVTIDRHAIAITLPRSCDQETVTRYCSMVFRSHPKGRRHYRYLSALYVRAARYIERRDGVRITPQQIQAIAWEQYRIEKRMNGRKRA